MLFFPDGYPVLQLVDQLSAGGQGGVPVYGAGRDHYGQLTDLEMADPVLHGYRHHLMRGGCALGAVQEDGRGTGVLAVVQRGDILPGVMVADHAKEHPDSADPGIRNSRHQLVHTQGRVADAG